MVPIFALWGLRPVSNAARVAERIGAVWKLL